MAESAIATKLEKEPAFLAEAWAYVSDLPCRLTVEIPMPGFRVADVLQLTRGAVINSHRRVGADVPVRVNGEPIANGEFEVVGEHLAIRLGELL